MQPVLYAGRLHSEGLNIFMIGRSVSEKHRHLHDERCSSILDSIGMPDFGEYPYETIQVVSATRWCNLPLFLHYKDAITYYYASNIKITR